jgi:hypothetical protein
VSPSTTPPSDSIAFDGVARCSRYAIGPNKLHLCGPDTSGEVLAYIRENAADEGLAQHLRQYRTLYPYLKTIARANHIRDPFDARVVEAYWIGNELLEAIPAKTYFRHLVDVVELKKRYPPKRFREVEEKLRHGGRMHHSFHVLNLYRRTGHAQVDHTLETFAQCLVRWGTIEAIDGPMFTVRTNPLLVEGHQLVFGKPVQERVTRRLWDDGLLEDARVGDRISIHWNTPCEILDDRHVQSLERYTALHVALANQTL